jgi:hyperosmotically inducible periplasmic protein
MQKGEITMKTIYSIALMGAAVATLSFSVYSRASETDDRIQSSAKDSYVFKTYLKNDNIKIESKDGFVVLTGTVSEESHKSLAKETISSLPKVRSVDDRLEVKGERPSEHSDAWITTKVKTNLMFHRHVSVTGTEVNTANGVVTLKGEAPSQTQKDLTTEYAKDVDGVKEVKNEMTIEKSITPKTNVRAQPAEGEKIDDASITGQIKVSLFSHRSTSALNTKVETIDGVVTLNGTAKNKSEKELVSKLSYDVYGVKSVNNRITIEKSRY